MSKFMMHVDDEKQISLGTDILEIVENYVIMGQEIRLDRDNSTA